jgi:hypothetical protein
MVGAPGSPSPPPRGPTINIFCVDGGRLWISGTTTFGVVADLLQLSVRRSQALGNASQGALYEEDVFSLKNVWVLAPLRTWRDNCQGEISE